MEMNAGTLTGILLLAMLLLVKVWAVPTVNSAHLLVKSGASQLKLQCLQMVIVQQVQHQQQLQSLLRQQPQHLEILHIRETVQILILQDHKLDNQIFVPFQQVYVLPDMRRTPQ
jgi:hypothetical protein